MLQLLSLLPRGVLLGSFLGTPFGYFLIRGEVPSCGDATARERTVSTSYGSEF